MNQTDESICEGNGQHLVNPLSNIDNRAKLKPGGFPPDKRVSSLNNLINRIIQRAQETILFYNSVRFFILFYFCFEFTFKLYSVNSIRIV